MDSLFNLSDYSMDEKPQHFHQWQALSVCDGVTTFRCSCGETKTRFTKTEAIETFNLAESKIIAAIARIKTANNHLDRTAARNDIICLLGSLQAVSEFLPKLQKVEPITTAITHSGQLAQSKTWIEEKMITRSGKQYGPYLYQRWIENGKQKSKYLGPKPKPQDPKIC